MSSYFLSLFLGTFILEDVALVSGISLASHGSLSWPAAFSALFLGISAGDIGLYVFGFLASRFPFVSRMKIFKKIKDKFSEFESSALLGSAVFFSRFIPGTRVATYTLSGFVSFSFFRFFILTLVSVFIWVLMALQLGMAGEHFFKSHMLLSILSLLIFFAIIRNLVRNLSTSWSRKIWIQSWRQWLSFEFWPPWLFYIPIVYQYIYLSLKYRSFYLPFYANPFIENGGLIGESKWDIYSRIPQGDFYLKTELIKMDSDRLNLIESLIEKNKFQYPFILKPDMGQRGFAVRIIKNKNELADYLKLAKFDLIIQEFCQWSHEAGVFYIRLPQEKTGRIFSITDKEFPAVIGDGQTLLGDLILNDKRARIMAGVYFNRFQEAVNSVPRSGEKVMISTCGNHCQGAIFKNGVHLQTSELLQAIESVALNIPDFYFGRFDIRYLSPSDLKAGKNFKIVELNAAGSEATHIWDPQTSLLTAYRVLFQQWEYLFLVGYQIKKMNQIKKPIKVLRLFKEIFNLNKREKQLTVSS